MFIGVSRKEAAKTNDRKDEDMTGSFYADWLNGRHDKQEYSPLG